MKKVVKCSMLIILFSILIVEIIKVVRLLDINGIINIGHDAWIGFFGNLLEILVTVIGFGFTIYKFLDEKEEKEKPLIIIKPSYEKDCYYRCDNVQNNFTQHRKVYFELVNKGDMIIKYPQIKNEDGKILTKELPKDLQRKFMLAGIKNPFEKENQIEKQFIKDN